MPDIGQKTVEGKPLERGLAEWAWESVFGDKIVYKWTDQDVEEIDEIAQTQAFRGQIDRFCAVLGEMGVASEDCLSLLTFLRTCSETGADQAKAVDTGLMKRGLDLSLWKRLKSAELKEAMQSVEALSLKNGERVNFLAHLDAVCQAQVLDGVTGQDAWKRRVGMVERLKKDVNYGGLADFMTTFWSPLRRMLKGMSEEEVLETALDFRKRNLNSVLVFDWLSINHVLLEKDGPAFLKSFLKLVDNLQKGRRMNLGRVLQMLKEDGRVEKLVDLERVALLVEKQVYPTPKVWEQLQKIQGEKEMAVWLTKLAGKMDEIRESETVDPKNDLELEMYYAFLNINVGFPIFKEVLGKLDPVITARKSQQWEKIRISARGAEAITKDIDEQKVNVWRNELLALARPEAAIDFIKAIPGLNKTVLDKLAKRDFLLGFVSYVLDEHGSKVVSNSPKSPFNETNVLGKTEAILKLQADFTKMSNLGYAAFSLGEFIKKSEALIKDTPKMIATELAAIQKNIVHAKELGRMVVQTQAKDAMELIKKFDIKAARREHISILTEYHMHLQMMENLSAEEQKVHDGISMILMDYSLLQASTSQKVLKRGMQLAVAALSSGAIASQEARKKLFEGLKISCLMDSEATVTEMESGKAEVILENIYDLLRDRVEEKLEQDLAEDEQRNDGEESVPRKMVRGAYQFGKLEAREVLRKVVSSVNGLITYLEKNSQNEKLKAAVAAQMASLQKKLKEVDGYYDLAPEIIRTQTHRTYHAENTKHASGSLGYVTSRNRFFDELIAMPDLTEADKKILETTKSRLTLHKDLLDEIHFFFEGLRHMENDETIKHSAEFTTIYHQFITKIKTRFKQFPAYIEFKAKLESMENVYNVGRKALKKRLYDQYLADHGGEYDPAEFNAILRPQIKEQEKAHGAKLKELRSQFEKDHAEIIPVITLLEKLLKFARDTQEGLDPISKLKQSSLSELELELSKITYSNLAEDEFEMVPSKTLGDGLKGWVSDDCSTGKVDHVHNSCFINYRVYRKEGNERNWMGNIYILDATYQGEPVLVMDAIQVARSAATVNYKEFMQRAVEGLATMAHKLNYKYIIANKIKSAAEGWLISNRAQFKQAYLDLYGTNDSFTAKSGELVMADTRGSGFQSFTYGVNDFVIMWKHPEMELVVSLEDLEKQLKPKLTAQVMKELKATYKKAKFNSEMVFQSRRGQENLSRLLQDDKKLNIFVSLFARLADEKSSHAVLMDERKFEVIVKFAELGEEVAVGVISRLIGKNESNTKYFEGLLEFKDRDGGADFIKAFLRYQTWATTALFEPLFRKYKQFLAWGLEKEFMIGLDYRVTETTLAKNDQLLGFLGERKAVLQDRERDNLSLGLKHGLFDADIDLEKYLVVLEKYQQLYDRCEGRSMRGLEDSHTLLLLIKLNFRDNLDVMIALFDWHLNSEAVPDWGRMSLILYKKLIQNSEDIPKLMGVIAKLDEQSEKKRGLWIDGDQLLTLLGYSPDKLDMVVKIFDHLFNDVENETVLETKMLFCKQFLNQGNFWKAYLVAKAEDELVDIFYFFYFHLDSVQLEEGEGLESLQKKFLASHFDETVLGKYADMRNLLVSGKDYLFVKSAHSQAVARMFDPLEMSKMKRVQRGEGEKIDKALKAKDAVEMTEEEMENMGVQKIGYESVGDWVDDQKSVYDLDFHN